MISILITSMFNARNVSCLVDRGRGGGGVPRSEKRPPGAGGCIASGWIVIHCFSSRADNDIGYEPMRSKVRYMGGGAGEWSLKFKLMIAERGIF
jgi:hypothetical protein